MRLRFRFGFGLGLGLVSAVGLVAAALSPAGTPAMAETPTEASAKARVSVAQYARARKAYEEKASAYWSTVAEKRRTRLHKRRANQPVALDDYVLTQPPVYSGPARPPGYVVPRDPARPRHRIPVMADFLKNAAEEFRFAPQRPENDAAFKEAYARAAAAAGLTKDQIVRVYAFETGGNGAYDVQAGLLSRSKNARAISAALGYNQLLNTNTIGLLAEHGEDFIRTLSESAETMDEKDRQAMARKIAAMRRMIAFSRSVPFVWSEHDKLAKTTSGGIGVHALLLDRDIGPLLQVQKLLNSVKYARSKGVARTLTAAELEMMNLTGDGNGIDLVTMPQEWREKVPTSNFFQRGGYWRNPIAQRAGTAAGLFAAIDAKMDRASQQDGARELAAAFENRRTASGL